MDSLHHKSQKPDKTTSTSPTVAYQLTSAHLPSLVTSHHPLSPRVSHQLPTPKLVPTPRRVAPVTDMVRATSSDAHTPSDTAPSNPAPSNTSPSKISPSHAQNGENGENGENGKAHKMGPGISPRLCVAYQGEPGAYSHQASCQFFEEEDSLELFPCPTFADIVRAVNDGRVHRAVLPIENCQAGTIHSNLDLLLRHPHVTIVGEMDFAVHHCMLALPGVAFADIKTVRSHYMALEQCDSFINDHGLKSEIAYDTAGSAKLLQKEGATDVAAIASKVAADTYNLNILREGIQNDFQNYTRFLILSTCTVPYVPLAHYKTSLAFCLDNSPGVLWRAISVFGALGIDMSKIESRHIYTVRKALGPPVDQDANERRWGYVFYVDFKRHVDEPPVAAALIVLQQMTTFYRVLGSYPSEDKEHIDEGNNTVVISD